MTAAIVPVSEYLNTTWRPDCEYVDGEVRERNTGETDHSSLQMLLSRYLATGKPNGESSFFLNGAFRSALPGFAFPMSRSLPDRCR